MEVAADGTASYGWEHSGSWDRPGGGDAVPRGDRMRHPPPWEIPGPSKRGTEDPEREYRWARPSHSRLGWSWDSDLPASGIRATLDNLRASATTLASLPARPTPEDLQAADSGHIKCRQCTEQYVYVLIFVNTQIY